MVRAGEPINDMNGKTLGRFVRLIAKAHWDTRLSVESSDAMARRAIHRAAAGLRRLWKG